MRVQIWLVLFFAYCGAQAQLRLTGVVLDRDNLEPVYGASILNLNHIGGTTTDSLGFFSISAYDGDTLVFSDVRYVKSQFVVPMVLDQPDYGMIQLLTANVRMLDSVSIYALPSEDAFKEAFMRYQPQPGYKEQVGEMRKSLQQAIRESYESDKYYYELWADRRIYELTGEIPPNHFLDPFKWTEFIQDLKRQKNKE